MTKKDQYAHHFQKNKMIGLIFGETDFPKYIYQKIKKRKNFVIIDLTKNNFFKKKQKSFSVSIGQFGKIINILKQNKCKKVLFAGKVKKPNFSKLKLDFKGIYYISRLIKKSKKGDAAIIKEIISIFKKEGITTIDSTALTPELNLSKGSYSKFKPNKKDKFDIKKALNVLKKINPYDYTQGAVSRDGLVFLEKKDGTKKMLQKIHKKKNINNGVLVKFPKKKQDLRVDLPTVGLDTLKQCKASGVKGIVLKHKKNIFLDKKKSIRYANKNQIFILVK